MEPNYPRNLQEAALDLYEACKEFVRKVESKQARSVRSYAQMKAAIAKADGLDGQDADRGKPLSLSDQEPQRSKSTNSVLPGSVHQLMNLPSSDPAGLRGDSTLGARKILNMSDFGPVMRFE